MSGDSNPFTCGRQAAGSPRRGALSRLPMVRGPKCAHGRKACLKEISHG